METPAFSNEDGGKKTLASTNEVGAKQPSASSNEAGGKQSVTSSQTSGNHTTKIPKKIGHKYWFSCQLCKGDHRTHLCPGIPKVWRVWSQSQGDLVPKLPLSSQHPSSPTSTSHAGDQPSTNDNKVKGRKGRVKFHCRL